MGVTRCIVRHVHADVVTTPPTSSALKGKERGRTPPVEIVQVMQEDDDDDDDKGSSSSDYADSDDDYSPGSPAGMLAFTSVLNSQEDAGGSRKSLR